ncbi:hypothetical protein EV363DRAFT_1403314 [Boletus edulis]|nr:hypothetical protein EV363DRAFT_1403314 [Boletus edulis]
MDLGLCVQLAHPPGETCHNLELCWGGNFVVINTNGIHTISLDFCNCEQVTTHCQQPLHFGWFPNCYEAFLRMSRQWWHLKMMKHAGCSFDPYGVKSTPDGECALICPACPQPGKNLPLDFYEQHLYSPDKKWLYVLFVAIDANFHLKQKKVSKDSVDPSLSQGWGYFVEETAYKDYLDQRKGIVQEKSTCSSHSAINTTDTKGNQGLSATGVGMIDCARHNMKLPVDVGDLQKGEKYINMDYLFFSMLHHNSTNILKVSYDVACQWNKHLWQCMDTLPSSMQLDVANMDDTFFIPKFHLPAHIAKCQTTYSFNFLPEVGHTDGEAPERGWANINPIMLSTKEMGPGARRDILDNYFGYSNWRKMVCLCKKAVLKRAELHAALEELKEGLAVDHADLLSTWRMQVLEWERDQTKLNPYERAGNNRSLAMTIAMGSAMVTHSDCTTSILISAGLELEEQHSNMLQCHIDSWAKLQHLFLPVSPASPETYKLMLPSQLGLLPCDESLKQIKWRLHTAQAYDALHSLRANLRAKTCVLKYKDRNLSQSTIKAIKSRINAAASRYNDAHKALVSLAPALNENGWNTVLHPLAQQDIRGLTDLLWGKTEGKRKPSWTWNVGGTMRDETDKEVGLEDMRTEWCKAMAHAKHWEEEAKLLMEEMQQIVLFWEWDAARWDERGKMFRSYDHHILDGHCAYVQRQATLCHSFAQKCQSSWSNIITL